MRLHAVELIRILLHLKTPFRNALGVMTERDALLVHVITDSGFGWGECVAPNDPLYTSEYTAGAHAVLRDHLVPRVIDGGDLSAEAVANRLAPIAGHRMAKAALETAVLDAQLRSQDLSLASYLGGTRDAVVCGVALGITESVDALIESIETFQRVGYRRFKVKIRPGWDREPLMAVRHHFGPDLPLAADANGAYAADDAALLASLDDADLVMLEQPFSVDDLVGHANLAASMRTRICLDESIVSAATAERAIALGACSIVNIKPGRVGGIFEAMRIHAVCQVRGVDAWCGGMFETGVGRAANLALAALPGFTLPADVSPSGRHYVEEIVRPASVMVDGCLPVPTAAGIGVDVRREVVDSLTTEAETLHP